MVGNKRNFKTSYKKCYFNFATSFKTAEKNEVAGAYSAFDGGERRIRGFDGKT